MLIVRTGRKGLEGNATIRCSFCGKSQHEVDKLIAGPTVFICDECVDLCVMIIEEGRNAGKSVAQDQSDA